MTLPKGTAISTRTRGIEGKTYNLIHISNERVSVRVLEWMTGNGFQENRILSYVFQKRRWRPE